MKTDYTYYRSAFYNLLRTKDNKEFEFYAKGYSRWFTAMGVPMGFLERLTKEEVFLELL